MTFERDGDVGCFILLNELKDSFNTKITEYFFKKSKCALNYLITELQPKFDDIWMRYGDFGFLDTHHLY